MITLASLDYRISDAITSVQIYFVILIFCNICTVLLLLCIDGNGKRLLNWTKKHNQEMENPPKATPIDFGLEVCTNCGRTIGKLEDHHLWAGNVVCSNCHKKLGC